MSNEMNVCRLKAEVTKAEDVMQAFGAEGIASHAIGCVNWSDSYPYRPEVNVRIALNADASAILLHYHVEEQEAKAVFGEDNGNVWEDSCVEFFCIPAQDGIYYNLECNCVGTILMGAGTCKQDRQRAQADVLRTIQRWSSLGNQPLPSLRPARWDVCLIVPVTAFFKHRLTSLDTPSIRANFYKCGDHLDVPHFLSWSPIRLDKPNFHCPDFFGTLNLAD